MSDPYRTPADVPDLSSEREQDDLRSFLVADGARLQECTEARMQAMLRSIADREDIYVKSEPEHGSLLVGVLVQAPLGRSLRVVRIPETMLHANFADAMKRAFVKLGIWTE